MRSCVPALAISALALLGERGAVAGRQDRLTSRVTLASQNLFGLKRWSSVKPRSPALREDGLVQFSVHLGGRKRTVEVVARPGEWVDVGKEGGRYRASDRRGFVELPTVLVRARVSPTGMMVVERRWRYADHGLFGAGFRLLSLAIDGTLRGRYRSMDFVHKVPPGARTFDFEHAGERIRLYLQRGRIVAIGKLSE